MTYKSNPRSAATVGLNRALLDPLSRRSFLLGVGGAAAMGTFAAACGSNGASGSQSSSSPAKLAKAKVDGDLNILTWEGYIPQPVLDSFKKEYKVNINYSFIASEQEILRKLGSGQEFDLVFLDSTLINQSVDAGILQPVDHSQLKNYSEVLPYFQTPPYAPTADLNTRNAPYVGFPYATAAVGLAYRADKVTGMTGSFSDLWTQKEMAKGKTMVVDSADLALAVAFAHLGLSLDTESQKDYDAAVAALRELKPFLSGFGSVETKQDMVEGNGWLLTSYAGSVYSAIPEMSTGEDLRFQYCKESALYGCDNACIPSAAKHPGSALLLMDWMLEPLNMAACVNSIAYIVPTKTGVDTYNALVKNFEWLKTDATQLTNPKSWNKSRTAAQRKMQDAAWVEVKAG